LDYSEGMTGVAPSTLEGFQERVVRLYEQDAPPEEIRQRIGQYVRRWKRWVVGGVRVLFPLAWFSSGIPAGPLAAFRTTPKCEPCQSDDAAASIAHVSGSGTVGPWGVNEMAANPPSLRTQLEALA
jgi:hypothetical protein